MNYSFDVSYPFNLQKFRFTIIFSENIGGEIFKFPDAFLMYGGWSRYAFFVLN